MKKLFMTMAVTLVIGSLASPAQAQGCCYTPCCMTYQTCVVTTYRPEWRDEKVQAVVDNWTCREVVDKVKVKVMVPHWVDDKQVVYSCRYQPRVIQRDVVRCAWVPVCFMDPCTGCPYTCWRPQTYIEHVACTVYETIPVQTVVPVKVCRMAWEDRVVDSRRLVWENKPQQVTTMRRFCVMVAQPTTVTVPVYVPCCSPAISCAYCPW